MREWTISFRFPLALQLSLYFCFSNINKTTAREGAGGCRAPLAWRQGAMFQVEPWEADQRIALLWAHINRAGKEIYGESLVSALFLEFF